MKVGDKYQLFYLYFPSLFKLNNKYISNQINRPFTTTYNNKYNQQMFCIFTNF